VRITYVLPRPELSGGIKVVFQHARLLQERGFQVIVLGEGPYPDWVAGRLPYYDYRGGPPPLPRQDLVIGTFWTTLALARQLVKGPLAHFCQGYEGGLPHLAPRLPEIEAAYAEPLPTITVTPSLAAFLRERFGRASRVVSPPADPVFWPAARWGPRKKAPWIAVPGIFESAVKGIPTALEAVSRLRQEGIPARLLRASILPLSAAERQIAEPDRYLLAVPPVEMADALRDCDLLLFPSYPAEGFGLPLLEAMVSGVPAVSSRIPSTEYIAGDSGRNGKIPLVPPGDAAAFAAAARDLLTRARTWRRSHQSGLREARRFAPERTGLALEIAVRWAIEEAHRHARG
jgi:glycosyltransferase involved in cell wall biosynthesis